MYAPYPSDTDLLFEKLVAVAGGMAAATGRTVSEELEFLHMAVVVPVTYQSVTGEPLDESL
jgi:hypothetical protein